MHTIATSNPSRRTCSSGDVGLSLRSSLSWSASERLWASARLSTAIARNTFSRMSASRAGQRKNALKKKNTIKERTIPLERCVFLRLLFCVYLRTHMYIYPIPCCLFILLYKSRKMHKTEMQRKQLISTKILTIAKSMSAVLWYCYWVYWLVVHIVFLFFCTFVRFPQKQYK